MKQKEIVILRDFETELFNTHIDVLILHLQLIYSVLAVYIFSECSV